MALGFGEAGSEIIAKNMKVGGSVDPMLPGKKILAIYGFCAIRYFAEATEVLENKIMLFANEIAEIVHSVNDSFYGAINKNLGDCFLIIWKLHKRHKMILLNDKDEIVIKDYKKVQNFSDCAVMAFVKTLA